MALDAARGLAYLHRKRIAWLDCKSSNVLLTKCAAASLTFLYDGYLESTFVSGKTPGSKAPAKSNITRGGLLRFTLGIF